jgi:Na+(H+)/acetate symporter ActP
MWDIKSIMLFICSVLVIILISVKANANPVVNWFETEKNKTIEYQKNSWANGKEQLANTKQSILNLFYKVKENVTQD